MDGYCSDGPIRQSEQHELLVDVRVGLVSAATGYRGDPNSPCPVIVLAQVVGHGVGELAMPHQRVLFPCWHDDHSA